MASRCRAISPSSASARCGLSRRTKPSISSIRSDDNPRRPSPKVRASPAETLLSRNSSTAATVTGSPVHQARTAVSTAPIAGSSVLAAMKRSRKKSGHWATCPMFASTRPTNGLESGRRASASDAMIPSTQFVPRQ